MWTGKPVSQEIALRLQLSLQVAVMATILAVLLAIPLGTLSALYKDTWIDHAIRVFSIAGLAVPSFWLGMIIILVLLSYFHWHPAAHLHAVLRESAREPVAAHLAGAGGGLPLFRGGDPHDALHAARSAAGGLHPHRARQGRVRAAGRGRGTRCRNAMLPVVTVIGLEFAFLIGGLVVTEQVFNLNGIGKLFVQAVARSDFTMVQALVLLVATFFIVVNFVIDLLYAWLDPRIRYR